MKPIENNVAGLIIILGQCFRFNKSKNNNKNNCKKSRLIS